MIRSAAGKVMWGQRARNLAFCLLALVVAASIGLLLSANPAHADTIIRVNSMEDAGDNNPGNGTCSTAPFPIGTEPNCTLRAAIQEANVNGVSDTIIFDSFLSGTITLTLGQLVIANDIPANDLSIEGPGARKIVVGGNNASGVFRVNSNTNATIGGLTISDGEVSPSGGGIFNGGTLTLTDSAVSGNTANVGPFGTLGGGGIFNGGTLALRNTTVSGNAATFFGGGITNYGTLEVSNSTVSGNTIIGDTGGGGGGIYNFDGTVELLTSTVSGNTANSGGGILNDSGTSTLSNTIVASNVAGTNPNAQGTFTTSGNNLIGDVSGSSGWGSSDLLNVDPLLGPLQNNGGSTDTHALLGGSPSIDAGTNTGCPATDQRGVARPQGPRCDIGSFESSDFTPPKVKRVVPAENTTGVAPGANVSAFFSEAMDKTTITKSTFKLFKKGTTRRVAATVSYDTGTMKAILNPTNNLKRGTTYKATVTTGAKDPAGNRLYQKPGISGNQPKKWLFKVKN